MPQHSCQYCKGERRQHNHHQHCYQVHSTLTIFTRWPHRRYGAAVRLRAHVKDKCVQGSIPKAEYENSCIALFLRAALSVIWRQTARIKSVFFATKNKNYGQTVRCVDPSSTAMLSPTMQAWDCSGDCDGSKPAAINRHKTASSADTASVRSYQNKRLREKPFCGCQAEGHSPK